ncbi:hypothetical protein [Rhizobium leguminosarum]|uniref:hypothetical protein n=1 Tax=Rhizobium leguminosarum TaxID=384 RepID=UPI0010E1556C|nr:hypothetical protein [Rhizobium leguminosarum]TAX24988.1 hypothetical protein ELI05_31720 [Rhizobium leguminosarum]
MVAGAGQSPLSSGRLTNAVRRSLHSLLPNDEGKQGLVLATLKSLEVLGDVVDVGSGHWVAPPARAVRTEDESAYLAIGSWPTAATYLKAAGPARYLCGNREKELARTLTIDADVWLGEVDELEKWTKRAIAAYSSRMAAINVSAESFEVYAPDHYRNLRQFGRWLSMTGSTALPPGLRLFRPQQGMIHNRPYSLGHFVRRMDETILTQAAQVDIGDARRLRFGFDARLGVPRTLRGELGEGRFTALFPRDMPAEETKVLALGRIIASTATMTSVQFPAFALPFVRRALSRIHCKLELTGGDHGRIEGHRR